MGRRDPQALVPDDLGRDRPEPLDADQLALHLGGLEPGARVADPVVEDAADVVVALPDVGGDLADPLPVGRSDGPDLYRRGRQCATPRPAPAAAVDQPAVRVSGDVLGQPRLRLRLVPAVVERRAVLLLELSPVRPRLEALVLEDGNLGLDAELLEEVPEVAELGHPRPWRPRHQLPDRIGGGAQLAVAELDEDALGGCRLQLGDEGGRRPVP